MNYEVTKARRISLNSEHAENTEILKAKNDILCDLSELCGSKSFIFRTLVPLWRNKIRN